METLIEIYELVKVVFIIMMFIAIVGIVTILILSKIISDSINHYEEENEELF